MMLPMTMRMPVIMVYVMIVSHRVLSCEDAQ